MSYNIKTIGVFEKQAKRLIKKYASLKNELLELVRQLKETPDLGTPIGSSCYKIHLAIASKEKANPAGKDNHQPGTFYPINIPPKRIGYKSD